MSLKHVGTATIPSIRMTPSDHCGLVLQIKLTDRSSGGGGGPAAGLVLGRLREVKSGTKKRKATGAPAPTPSVAALHGATSSNQSGLRGEEWRRDENGGHTSQHRDDDEAQEDEDDADMKLALQLSLELMQSSQHKTMVSTQQLPPAATSSLEKAKRRAGFLQGLAKRTAKAGCKEEEEEEVEGRKEGGRTVNGAAGNNRGGSGQSSRHISKHNAHKDIEIIEISD
jgi:hypothetical protein